MKLYRSTRYDTKWFAYVPRTGWVMFPAVENGWQKREPARGIDPLDIREVPIRLAENTGITTDVAISDAPDWDSQLGAAA